MTAYSLGLGRSSTLCPGLKWSLAANVHLHSWNECIQCGFTQHEMTSSCPCCPCPALVPKSQDRRFYFWFCPPPCFWCYFLVSQGNQKRLNFPFPPSRTGKRKPALIVVALTGAGQLPRMWGKGRAALGRHIFFFLPRRNESMVFKGKIVSTCGGGSGLILFPQVLQCCATCLPTQHASLDLDQCVVLPARKGCGC